MKTALTDNWLVCRVCLKPSQDDMLRIFNEDDVQDLTQMMLECGGIPIKRFDHYPDKICQKCYKYLRVAYKFRITCQRSHNHLSKMIAPVQVEAKDEQSNEDWETEVGVEIDEAGDETPKMDILAIKEELGAIEEHSGDETNDVVDVYEPMDDDIEANEAAFEELDSIQRMQENDDDDDIKDLDDDDDDVIKDIEDDEIKDIDDPQANDVKEDEYYDDFMADVTTSDEEFLPTKRGGPKRGYQKRVAPTKTTSPHRKRVKGEAAKAPKDQPVEKKKRGPKPKEPTTYICDMCGNIYPTQGRLNEHLKLHKGVKPHVCEICGHAFAQTQQLARHMNTHTGNRPFKCSFCPAAFADLSTRNKHHRIHTNERPYVCDVCGKSFTYTNTLKFHKMIHTGEKPHVCDICGKGFMQAYKMRNHRAIHLKKGIKLQRLEVEQVTHFNEATEGAVLEICAQ